MRLRVLICCAVLAGISFAGDWPQWRGPAGNGVSEETNLPLKWTNEENVTWKLPMPSRSGSTPIIWKEHIFLNVAEGDNLEAWAVDRNSAKVLWKRPVTGGNYKINKQNMSSPSPVTDGKTVWFLTGTGILKAFDFAGKELWMRDIQKDYGAFGLMWGYGSSPLLYNGSLYVPVLHGMKTDETSYLLRIDARTGKTIFKQDRPTTAQRESPDAYVTPQLLRYDGRVEIVLNGGDCVTGHDPQTGKELWRSWGLNPNNDGNFRIIASSLTHDGIVYAPTRIRPMLAIKAGGRGDISNTHVLWKFENGPDVPSPVTDGKYLYVPNDRGILWVLDAKTGKEVYGGKRIQPAIYSSSPVLADGKVYITNEEGTTTVLKAGAEFEVLAENALGEYTLSSPAVSNGQIFLRTEKFLYCIGKRRP
ncbi:MAG: PQQ-binding-like beta-propeller repeat protein [Bryobacteraceae bacterium]|nr:PQQ-binding-like beta-propeller repeat protein [Bryobacteraceae bacterium]